MLGMSDDPADAGTADAVLAEATAVLTAPALRPYFGANTLAEVALTCPLPGMLPAPHTQLIGIVDSLVVTDDHVLAIDYKSNRVVPVTPEDTPEGLLRQMGAYCAALEQIYPDRRVETALLWTSTAQVMHLPHALVMTAFQRAGQP
jgi:ATP-dependent helicase/nuclease subunit A